MRLTYKSLVTKENIENSLSKIEDKQTKSNLINLLSKIDIRISTEPVIVGNEFYYKIWILKKGTKHKAHIKDYYSIELLDKKLKSPITLVEILEMIRIDADVPDDFEEYCEMHLKDPSDPICRVDYLDDLKRAEGFKKFLNQDEIRSMSFSFDEDNYNLEKEIEVIDMNNEANLQLLGYKIISLNDKKEYDKLADLDNALEYYMKIIESFACEIDINELNQVEVSIYKDNLEKENIEKYIENYNQTMKEYTEHFRFLIKKYKIKPSGNISKRLAFTFGNDNNEQQSNKKSYKPIVAILDYKSFSV